jgi:hypothetical protein
MLVFDVELLKISEGPPMPMHGGMGGMGGPGGMGMRPPPPHP